MKLVLDSLSRGPWFVRCAFLEHFSTEIFDVQRSDQGEEGILPPLLLLRSFSVLTESS